MLSNKILAFSFAIAVFSSCGSSDTKQEEAPQTPDYVRIKAGLIKSLEEPRIPFNNCRDSVCVRYEVITLEQARKHVVEYPSDVGWITTFSHEDPSEKIYLDWQYSFKECDDDGKYLTNPKMRLQSTDVNAFILWTALPQPEKSWHACEYFVKLPKASAN